MRCNEMRKNVAMIVLVATSITWTPVVEASSVNGNTGHHPMERPVSDFVRSEIDLEAWLADEPGDSALRLLTDHERDAFLNSLYFSDRGLASFSSKPLNNLRPSQISAILSLFGLADTLDTVLEVRDQGPYREFTSPSMLPRDRVDYPGYVCISRANCAKSANDNICIGGNC